MTSVIVPGFGAFLLLSGCTTPASDVRSPVEPGLRFVDVTKEAGLSSFRHENGAYGGRLFPETMSGAVAFIDSNGDGWQDILVTGGGVWRNERHVPAVRLFENAGDGTFREVTDAHGLGKIAAYGMGLAVADYDNDGDDDFFLSTVFRDLLFRNEGAGIDSRFVEVANEVGVAGDSTWGSSALFFDADRDGFLDLFVGQYVEWSPETDLWCMSRGKKSYCTPEVYEGSGPRFYRNDRDGTFSDRTLEAGFLPAGGKTLGVAEMDFNDDGWSDLVVANDTEPDQLYRNNRDGTFAEIGVRSGIAYDERGVARAGMGIDAGVVDQSGHATVFVGNFSNEMIGVYACQPDFVFADRAAVSRIGGASRRSLSFGLFLFDVDLDADLDVFVANGHIIPEVDDIDDDITFRQPPHLFLNDGQGVFQDAVPEVGGTIATALVGRGAAFADYDGDGDLDVAVSVNGGPLVLLRNEVRIGAAGPSYLRLELTSTRGNRSAIGSNVRVFSEGLEMVRRVRSGGSYLSQAELPVTFGLADADRVDSIQITWPDGTVQRLRDVPANQTLQVEQGAALTLVSAPGDNRSND